MQLILSRTSVGPQPSGMINGSPVSISGSPHAEVSEDFLLSKHSRLIDELCQLHNREGFIDASAQWQKRWGRRAPWALLLSLQVNHLKVVHHALGHKVSAALLMRTAVLLREVFRQAAIIGRLSEDEFVVLVRVASPSAGTALISHLNETIDAANASASGLSLSLSGGFSQFDPRYPVSITERLRLADSAMKRACARDEKVDL